jgi:hypothetical protein
MRETAIICPCFSPISADRARRRIQRTAAATPQEWTVIE